MSQKSQNPLTHCDGKKKKQPLKAVSALGFRKDSPAPKTKAVHSHPGNIQEAQETVKTRAMGQWTAATDSTDSQVCQ